MARSIWLAAGAALVALLGDVVPTMADETGLATSLHSVRREAGRLCLVDHFHNGNGSGASRKQAQLAAVQSWAGFTAFEYGTSWAVWNRSANKEMSCSGGGASWSCSVSARPCK